MGNAHHIGNGALNVVHEIQTRISGDTSFKQFIENDAGQDVQVEWGQGLPYPNQPPQPLKAGDKLRMTMLTDDQYFPRNYQFPQICVIPDPNSEEAKRWGDNIKFCKRGLPLPGDDLGKAKKYTVSEVLKDGAITPNYWDQLKDEEKYPEFGPDSPHLSSLEARSNHFDLVLIALLAVSSFVLIRASMKKNRSVQRPVRELQGPLLHS